MSYSNGSVHRPDTPPPAGVIGEHERLGVLVVDDDGGLLRTLADILRRKGYDPQTASSAGEGLALVSRDSAHAPAIALVDLRLPDMNGIEMIHRLRELSELTEVVILTGNASVDSAVAALREESFDYLLKPVAPELLLGTLHRAGERWRRRRAEESLRRSEDRFRSLVENISDVLIVVNREGIVRYANGRVVAALGVTAAEAEGTPVLARVHADDLEVAKELLRSPTADPVEVRLRRRGGDLRVFACRSAELPEDGEAGGVVILAQDVTDRRRLEAQAMQAQKLDSIGRLAGGVAHDFNNLLTIVLGYTELALRADLNDDLRSLLQEVHAAGERGAALTRQLLAFARRQPTAARPVDPNQVVRGLEPLLRRTLGEDVALEMRLDPAAGIVRVDPGQLEQVVMNLAFNGREAMPRGGRLTISTQRIAADVATAAAAHVLVAVSDTGVGIDEETRSRVFDPFFSTKPQGTGLGLATVYGIVHQAGGEITIDSALGKGTTVEVHLPLVGQSTAMEAAEARQAPPGVETILVVDDEPAVRDVLGRILESQGYRCVVAEAAEAVRLVESGELRPSLLLTDLVMPGLGGEEVAMRVRAVLPRLPALFLSGYSDRPSPTGELPVLAKPVNPQTLAAAIRSALEHPARRYDA